MKSMYSPLLMLIMLPVVLNVLATSGMAELMIMLSIAALNPLMVTTKVMTFFLKGVNRLQHCSSSRDCRVSHLSESAARFSMVSSATFSGTSWPNGVESRSGGT